MKKNVKTYGAYPRDEDKYKGEYLVVMDKKILAHSQNFGILLPLLKKYAKKSIVTKVPTIGWKEAMVL